MTRNTQPQLSVFGSLIVITAFNDAINEEFSLVFDNRETADREMKRLQTMEHISRIRGTDAVFVPNHK